MTGPIRLPRFFERGEKFARRGNADQIVLDCPGKLIGGEAHRRGADHSAAANQQPDRSKPREASSSRSLFGQAVHHAIRARVNLNRAKLWQAEYWISGIRDHTLALACLRLGENAVYGRGVDRLPATVTDPLADALVRSLDEQELRRALAVATMSLIGELEEWDPALCSRLKPLLQEFGAPQAEPLQ